ncbi:Sec-independent protein translocase protein TatB [Streptomyces sp. NBC_01310]|uniref:Sec-independent protein translocase protein TatB n=1 Tax=Streptomyces sp. NBC_01310 TaxID=2903820 RepID=UPI0035B5BE57|nr:Sec-independent protein translocase protein TatB [Streptomyces sp. NBC_01310]WSJ63697.1 Sec-independent protein translocase protein TatB [Streptomyces sp. NBC_01310]
MFFDMGPLEVLAIAVIAIVVLGPEKLPRAIQEVSAVIRKIRSLSQTAQTEIRKELGPEFSDLNLQDLTPRNLTHKAVSSTHKTLGLGDLAKTVDLNSLLTEDTPRPRPTFTKAAK